MLDETIAFTEESTPWWHSLLLVVYLLAAIGYVIWRIDITTSQLLWFSIPLFSLEIYSILTTILHLVVTRRLLHPTWQPPLAGRTVDAFIPTYNEASDIVEMTALGALRIRGIRHVYILDDGAREPIRTLAERIGARYLQRDTNLHAKAGNMNNGLAHSDAEFVIFLDCDHVPQPRFIERTLGYFANPKLAFVQTPQVFYNFRSSIQFRNLSFRTLWNEQTMFYENIQPAKNRFNAAFFCGSGAMLRRSALDSVGGFATGTATEDIHTSLRIHATGWRSLFLAERLAFGIAAEDFREYHAQRVRWGAGSLGLLFRSADSPLVKRGLSPMQRLCYLGSTNAYLYGGIIRLLYLAFPVAILFAAPFLPESDNSYFVSYLTAALPFFALSIVVTYLYSRRTFHPLYSEQYNIANILACLMALRGIFKVEKKFRVSIKSKRTKENSFAFYFIVALAGIMILAEAFLIGYWLVARDGSIDRLPSYAVILSVFWNTYNLVFVVSLVKFLHRFNRRPATRYPFYPASTQIRFAGDQVGRVRSISLQGAIVSANTAPTSDTVRAEIDTRFGPISLSGQLTGHERYRNVHWFRIDFQNLPVPQRRQLTRYFFGEIIPEAYSRDFPARQWSTDRIPVPTSRQGPKVRLHTDWPSVAGVGDREPEPSRQT